MEKNSNLVEKEGGGKISKTLYIGLYVKAVCRKEGALSSGILVCSHTAVSVWASNLTAPHSLQSYLPLFLIKTSLAFMYVENSEHIQRKQNIDAFTSLLQLHYYLSCVCV